MRLFPTAVVLAALALPLPASAAPGVFTATMHVDCFGCGASNADASFAFVPGGGPANGAFAVEAAPPLCPVAWTFHGQIRGGRNADVNATVVGSQMVITAIGDFTRGGGTITVTGPAGNPCGGPVDMSLAGWVL